MRRRTAKAAINLVAKAIPDDEAMTESILRGRRGIIEDCMRTLAQQQQYAAEYEAKKPGSWRARSFAKSAASWQERTDTAIAKYNELAAQYGRPAWNPDDAPQS
ncbi:hypothetical protein [Promicromonospora sp. NPDC050880]|uniref:hypothetical protein n=1 Tax=Promicromonospora sp. NPDC050880 TaxID=3364406 RepID=UPI0037BBE56C